MNILLIGSGGREHALAAKLAEFGAHTLYAAKGNPGIFRHAQNADIDEKDNAEIVDFCVARSIELVVVGPEAPLAAGLADALRARSIPVFGPSRAAARLESSKAFAKDFMQRYAIPTARYRTFGENDYAAAREYVATHTLPVVIKADGLAAGKGVTVAETHAHALDALDAAFDGKFGKAGKSVVVEEFMQGEEASVFAVCDGERFITLAPAQDHKRIGDGDTGENTGGMGAYAPAPIVTPELMREIEERIIAPTLSGMKTEGCPFIGCLYVGLMINRATNECRVVEYNARFGDPETQVVLAIADVDLPLLLHSAALGSLDARAVRSVTSGVACCVVLAASGYPGHTRKGDEITGIDETERAFGGAVRIFQAGVALHDESDGSTSLCTNGGRVLGVTARGNDLREAIDLAYRAVKTVHFRGKTYRSDIGAKGLRTL
jgi:phosphoribosylamine--glycine ligase